MIPGRPSRFVSTCVSTAVLFALVSAQALLGAGIGLSGTQANAPRSIQVELQRPQGTLFSRATSPTLNQSSSPQGSRVFGTPTSFCSSLAGFSGWLQAWPTAASALNHAVRPESDRAPPLSF